jgi:hypothetical protein
MTSAVAVDLGELGCAVVRLKAGAVRVSRPDGSPAPAALELAALAAVARRALMDDAEGEPERAEISPQWLRVH